MKKLIIVLFVIVLVLAGVWLIKVSNQKDEKGNIVLKTTKTTTTTSPKENIVKFETDREIYYLYTIFIPQ